ncbi:hypothetical protein OG883_11360 [Streptomyces sp. NBC_01142]|uniref:hypothetical protein n=1 Tax=Streptomyces sp. NBC_01142 TaxID=2975865 RepID=UPI0022581629|nr:hypothetical protein [Streptomyces sp. NBC_01142]MCX4820494.1 hypothetical protein [Streptomyces sp. NBC_01142]
MSRNRCLALLGAAPLLAALAISPAFAAGGAGTQESLPTAETTTAIAPNVCHGLSLPKDAYHTGCRQGFLLGSAAGRKDGSPPVCQKLPPPLAPVSPNDHERGKIQGYKYGYNQAYAKAFKENCTQKPGEPPPPQKPPEQTYDSMFNAGKSSGTTWALEDAKTCVRTHARLTPPAKPDVLIAAFQSGYAVGYDTAYDEAFRKNCQGTP